MGASLLSFVLSYLTKMSPPERREASFASRLVTKSIVFCHTDTSRLSGGDLLISARPRMRVAVLGGTGVKIGNVFLKKLGSGLHIFLRSSTWAWSQGERFSWGFFRGGFLHFLGDFFLGDLLGGSKMEKNMKMQDEIG